MSLDALPALLAASGFEKYTEAILSQLDELRSLSDTREQLALLKQNCGVGVLGHRHRIVALLAQSALSGAHSDAVDISESEPSPKGVQHQPAAVAVQRDASMPPHIASMVHRCTKLTGPLPFQGSYDEHATGERLKLDPKFPGLHRIHSNPPVYLIDAFLTDSECDAMMRCADPLLKQSLTDSGKSRVRTSKSTHLRKQLGPCPAMLARIQALTGKPVGHMEIPQVARYDEGQFYEAHFDASDEKSAASGVGLASGTRFFESGGNRIGTVLIYLNDVPSGGHTRFNRLGIEVAPRKGVALVFFPGFLDGRLDPAALHEALPAIDRKYVCQVWIKQRDLGLEAETEYVGMGHRLLDALYSSENGGSSR
jgi:prolyl 4-hydroxylase